jgi:predicted nucleic acid-binding protein/pimeloyl-ACP methyl ester carboxylesterase
MDPAELPDKVAISAITLAELSAGPHEVRGNAEQSDYDEHAERARRLDVLQRAENEFDPNPFDAEAARVYGRVCAAVIAAGRKPRRRATDLMIASVAIAEDMPLYTTNPDDFKGPTTSRGWTICSQSYRLPVRLWRRKGSFERATDRLQRRGSAVIVGVPGWAPPLIRVLVVATLVVAVLLALAWAGQRKLIYFPDGRRPPPPGSLLPGAREVAFQTEDGLRLGAWFVPAAAGGRAGAAAPVVLVAPGNAGNRAVRAPLAAALAARGVGVLLMDYRGYGGNPGSPGETGLDLDIRAAHRYLTEELKVPPGRLLYFGESLGAGVVTGLAVTHPPAGLVLRSPFVDLAAVGRAHYPFLPVGALLKDRFPVAERVAEIKVPTAVVYGTADSIVPAGQSRTVARRAAGPVRVVEVPGADHNDRVLLDGPQLIDAVVALAEVTR